MRLTDSAREDRMDVATRAIGRLGACDTVSYRSTPWFLKLAVGDDAPDGTEHRFLVIQLKAHEMS